MGLRAQVLPWVFVLGLDPLDKQPQRKHILDSISANQPNQNIAFLRGVGGRRFRVFGPTKPYISLYTPIYPLEGPMYWVHGPSG